MAITHDYALVPCGEIIIDRENRQRKDLRITQEFKDSISARGVLVPIIITREMRLIAGERRLTTSLELGLSHIPARFFEDLSPGEAQIVELEENLKRSDLSWQDTVRAVTALYSHYKAQDADFTITQFSKILAMHQTHIGRILRVGEDISSPRIAAMPTLETAFNSLKRVDERRAGDVISDIIAAAPAAFDAAPIPAAPPIPGTTSPAPTAPTTPANAPPKSEPSVPIEHVSFSQWLKEYNGAPFNFLHCDFPYGINVFDGEYGDAAGDKHYDDSPDVYFALIDLLAENLDKVLSYSAHVMFWFSMEHYEATFSHFRAKMPDVIWNKFPLIWTKSDNVGIMPDPKRGPRRTYETCLIGTRGDRHVVKPIANFYSCPTDKQYHPSTKPVPMLKHFFQMFVDNGTRMLDPTCGSGSALRAAISMGAPHVLGLEQDEEHYKNAVRAYTQFSNMRKLQNG